MQSPSVVLPLATLLLWSDSLRHCTGLLYRLAMQKKVTNIGIDKISAPAKISLIFTKL
jgi:hypothetical protein